MKSSMLLSLVVFLGACSCSRPDDSEIDKLRAEVDALQSQLEEVEDSAAMVGETVEQTDATELPPIPAPRNSFLKDFESTANDRKIKQLQDDVEKMKWQKMQADAEALSEKVEKDRCDRRSSLGLDC